MGRGEGPGQQRWVPPTLRPHSACVLSLWPFSLGKTKKPGGKKWEPDEDELAPPEEKTSECSHPCVRGHYAAVPWPSCPLSPQGALPSGWSPIVWRMTRSWPLPCCVMGWVRSAAASTCRWASIPSPSRIRLLLYPIPIPVLSPSHPIPSLPVFPFCPHPIPPPSSFRHHPIAISVPILFYRIVIPSSFHCYLDPHPHPIVTPSLSQSLSLFPFHPIPP